MTNQEIYLSIMNLYNKYSYFMTNEKIPYCRLKEKYIYIPTNDFLNPTKRAIFDLLHEIGHLETNIPGMKRYEEEFYATQWAIEKGKEYKLEISNKDKKLFQDYIWKWMETSRKKSSKNIPDNKCFVLSW